MATFAKIGLNGEVIEVHSIVNEVLQDANGVEQEKLGIDFLTELTIGQFGNKLLIILLLEFIY